MKVLKPQIYILLQDMIGFEHRAAENSFMPLIYNFLEKEPKSLELVNHLESLCPSLFNKTIFVFVISI